MRPDRPDGATDPGLFRHFPGHRKVPFFVGACKAGMRACLHR